MLNTFFSKVISIIVFFVIIIMLNLVSSSMKMIIKYKKGKQIEKWTDPDDPDDPINQDTPCGDISVTSPVKRSTFIATPIKQVKFTSPLLIDNLTNNVVNFNNDVLFNEKAVLDDNTRVSFDGNMYINSGGSIYFDYTNPSNKLVHSDVQSIKKAIGKARYINTESLDLTTYDNGVQVSSFSSQTGGSSKCGSTIWKILTGSQVPEGELCKSCCKKVENKGLIRVLIVNSLDHTKNELILNLSSQYTYNLQTFLKEIKGETVVLLFKTNDTIRCRLVFINKEWAANVTGQDPFTLDSTNQRELNIKIDQLSSINNVNKIKAFYEIRSDNRDTKWGEETNGILSYTQIITPDYEYDTVYLENMLD